MQKFWKKAKYWIAPAAVLSIALIWTIFQYKSVFDQRAEEYAERIERSERNAELARERLGELAELLVDARASVESGLTEIGEIRDVGARIAGTDGEFKTGIESLEGHVQRCIEILEGGETKDCNLENNGCCIYDCKCNRGNKAAP